MAMLGVQAMLRIRVTVSVTEMLSVTMRARLKDG